MKINTIALSVVVLALSIGLSPAIGRAQEPVEPVAQPSPEAATQQNLGYGLGSLVASMFYSPLKVTYAGLGLLTGGLGYVFSAGKADVANSIIFPAVRGDYIITPSQLKGEERVVFIGSPPPPESVPAQEAAVDSAPTQH